MDVLAPAVPVDEAEPALAGKLGKPRRRPQMQVGDMGEHEHRAMMIRESCGSQWLARARCGA